MTITTDTTPGSIPRLTGLPVLGNLLDLRFRRRDFFLRLSREIGDIGSFRVGPFNIIVVNTPELIESVLVEHARDFEKAPLFFSLARPLLGNGLLSSKNAFHKRQRKLVAPAFQHKRITSYANIMVEYAEELQNTWNDNEQIDIAHAMKGLALRTVGKTLFNVDLQAEAETLSKAWVAATHFFITESTKLKNILSYAWPISHSKHPLKVIKYLDAQIYKLIEEHQQLKEDQNDFLSMLLQVRDEDDGNFMNNRQVRDEIMTLLLAGHETIQNALSWAWYLVSRHHEVYKHMCTEVDTVLGGRPPTITDLPNLPYTLQVFKESLRLYPPAYVFGRYAVHSVNLGNYFLPAGSIVYVCPYMLHRRAAYFPDPEHFDPERFSQEKERSLPRYTYIPFGAGPRVCIGNQYAMMEGHLIMATLAQRVTFEFVGKRPIAPKPLLSLWPDDKIHMVVRRR